MISCRHCDVLPDFVEELRSKYPKIDRDISRFGKKRECLCLYRVRIGTHDTYMSLYASESYFFGICVLIFHYVRSKNVRISSKR